MSVIMMAGLQGAGKTTTTAKIAGKLKAKGRKPLLVACDVYRPAAITQLQINGEKQGVEVFSMGDKQNPYLFPIRSEGNHPGSTAACR